MAYQASRNTTDKEAEKARADANNTKNVRNAADVAMASKNPYGVAVGGAIKGADKLTGGKASEAIGKGLTKVGRFSPLGKMGQKASNKMAESGVSDKVGKAASLYNRGKGASGDSPNQVKNNKTAGGDQKEDSLPSSGDKKNDSVPPGSANNSDNKEKNKKENGGSETTTNGDATEENKSGESSVLSFGVKYLRNRVILASLLVAPFIILLIFFVIISSTVLGLFTNFEDNFRASEVAGEDNGNMHYAVTNNEQQAFFERINAVKLRYQSQGKSFEAYKVASVYSVLHYHNPKLSYNDMTEDAIVAIVDAMFSDNYYSDSIFKSNLSSKIIPKYISSSSSDGIADEIIKNIKDYESIIGKDHSSSGGYNSCASVGSCTYDIKGYYISDKGEVREAIQVNDLYVRLMECGIGNGHDYGGTFGKPLEGEALVPFEKYILGVAYQEIGPEAPAEAIKAQMVAARSYILARHKDMGGWRTLKQESGKWILRAASCTQDQVYCDPDQGCSSNDGQWGQIHSGLNHNSGFSREPMPKDSPLRSYATETSGEVLINKNGYIIYAGFAQPEQNQFEALANKGLNYKQILLQVYNQGSNNLGATDIFKSSCSNSSSTCSNSGLGYANWRQTDPAWSNIQMGSSGRTIGQIGCNVTSMAILIAKSGVSTDGNFNPGTFVEALNGIGMFDSGGSVQSYSLVSKVIPGFQYRDKVEVTGMSKQNKLNTLKNILADGNNYVMAEVKGDTGQHWVAIDSINGDNIKMMDPGSNATDMWSQYNWKNTSSFVYFKVG